MTLLEQLQQLAPLAAAATEAPWHVEFDYEGGLDVPMIMSAYGPISTIEEIHDNYIDEEHARATGDFIAAARNLLTPQNMALLVAMLAGPQNMALLLAAQGTPVADESMLKTLINEAVKAWAEEAWAEEDDEDDMTLPVKTNEQESADLLRCMRNAGLSIGLQPAPAHV